MMKPFILLINGSINAGKTTVSKILCAKIPQTAHIEVDVLRECIEWMPLEESIPLNLKNAASIAHNFLEYGLNVVISYPLNQGDFEYLSEQFRDYKLDCITLSPSLETAQQNRGNRELTAWEYNRIAFHYATGIARPLFPSIIIDNSQQTPQQTADMIINILKDHQ